MATTAIILAAGKGARMQSTTPKVLHKVCNLPMLSYVLEACRQAGCQRLICVIGYGADQVRAAYADQKDIVWVLQPHQLGTGHAVQVCREAIADLDGEILVLAGDSPLVGSETLEQMIAVHRRRRSACTLATSILPDGGTYGRIIRDEAGDLVGIVEYLDATAQQAQIREVNVSLYCFDAAALRQVIGQLRNDNVKGEYYLTDTLGMLRGLGLTLTAVPAVPPEDVLYVNSRVQLAQANRLMQRRIQTRHMLSGVTIESPESTWIDPRTTIGPDTTLRPMTVLDGACRIGRGCRIGPMVHLTDASVADGQTLEGRHG